ncbi:MAG: WbuC family cupin fold metalloprotein [Nitrospirae bacterium]|nr:WbuC family cupin fold metalloprotein [Nitrospirota bacterium]
MKQIDRALLDSLTKQAMESPRHRAHFNLHPELNDPVQRLCIAIEPGSYVRPHRHSDPETGEVLTALRGSLAILLFDERGKVLERTVIDNNGMIAAVEFPRNTWHTLVSLESGTVFFEVKQGPYKPIAEINSASWAPAEGAPEAAHFLNWFRNARAGDVPPVIAS